MTRRSPNGTLALDDEHPELAIAARRAINEVASLRSRLESADGIIRVHYWEFADRARHLVDHLDGALDLANSARYASAFSIVRTAMEHQIVDQLLFLADRYRQTFKDTPLDEHERRRTECAAGADWAADIASFERVGNNTVVIRRGHYLTDSAGVVTDQLSPYYRVLQNHHATLGKPNIQQDFDDGLSDVVQREQFARQNQALYRSYLTWPSLMDNLVMNNLYQPPHQGQLEVHYRFLRAFTHATQTGYEAIERTRGQTSEGPPHSHDLGELVFLYAATLAALELKTFCLLVDRRPTLIQLRSRSEIDSIIAAAESASRYLWYPGYEPVEFDRFNDANRRAWRSWDKAGPIPKQTESPTDIPDEEIGYYADPLVRLSKLHAGSSEMTTGLGYRAMWR